MIIASGGILSRSFEFLNASQVSSPSWSVYAEFRSEFCSESAMKTPKPCVKYAQTNNKDTITTSGVFMVNFKQISHIVLVFLLLNLNKEMPTGNEKSTNDFADIFVNRMFGN